jgi:short-subunit dehydrogenase
MQRVAVVTGASSGIGAELAFSRATAAELRSRRIRVHTVKPGFVETEGFPQSWLPARAQRLVLGPKAVAAHVLWSIDRERGETTVPRYYGIAGFLQATIPNVVARALGRPGSRITMRR